MTSSKPTPPKDVFGQTLDLLTKVSDADARRWGQGFDWWAPVHRPFYTDNGKLTTENIAPADQLVETGDARLIGLLLRQDMFEGSPKDRISAQTTWRFAFDEYGLWKSLWCAAISTGSLEVVRQVSKAAPPAVSLFSGDRDGHGICLALESCPRAARKAMLAHLLADEDGPVLRAVPRAHMTNRRADLSIAILKSMDDLATLNTVLSAWENSLPYRVFSSVIDADRGVKLHKTMTRGLRILEFVSEMGGFNQDEHSGGRIQLPSPLEFLARELANLQAPALTLKKIAQKFMEWPAGAIDPANPQTITKSLANHCLGWDDEMLGLARAISPNPSPYEVAALLVSGSDAHYQARLDDFVAHAKGVDDFLQIGTELTQASWINTTALKVSSMSPTQRMLFTQGDEKRSTMRRVWQRAAGIEGKIDVLHRAKFRDVIERAICTEHVIQPDIGEMLAIYEEVALEANTAPARQSSGRGVRL